MQEIAPEGMGHREEPGLAVTMTVLGGIGMRAAASATTMLFVPADDGPAIPATVPRRDAGYPSAEGRRSGGLRLSCSLGFPVPGQQFVEPVLRRVGDGIEDMGEPGLGVDAVHLGGDDEGAHEGGPVAAAIGTGEQP